MNEQVSDFTHGYAMFKFIASSIIDIAISIYLENESECDSYTYIFNIYIDFNANQCLEQINGICTMHTQNLFVKSAK